MAYAEIKAFDKVLSAIYNGCSCSDSSKLNNNMRNVQRLSHCMRVKPQVNGGRKMLPHI